MAFVGKAVLVTGDTFGAKDVLKSVAGGTWSKGLTGWIYPEDKRAEVTAALKKANMLSKKAPPAAAAAAPSVGANAKLTVRPHKRAIVIGGDTQLVKEQLKALKGSWNKYLSGWIFQGNRKEEVLEVLRADPTNTITEEESTTATPEQPAKKRKKTKKRKDDDDESD